MFQNRDAALLRIHFSELGFAVRSSEPGGAVNDGITMQTLQAWDAAHGFPVPTLEELKNLPLEEERTIYIQNVFEPLRFDYLQSGVDYAVADWAVNSGETGALDGCRKVCGLPIPAKSWRTEDPLLAALNSSDALTIINDVCDERWGAMQAAPDFWQPSHTNPAKHIGDGRAKRMNVAYGGALQFAGIPLPSEPRYTVPVKP